MMNVQEAVEWAIRGSLIGLDQILAAYGKPQALISKGGVDACTQTDKDVEKLARRYLIEKTGIPVFGEEEGGDRASRYLWITDKIDGTANFRAGVPLFGSAVSLLEGDDCLSTAIALPALGQIYVAGKGLGAYRIDIPQDEQRATVEAINGWRMRHDPVSIAQRLRTSEQQDPKDTLFASDISYKGRVEKLERIKAYIQDSFYPPIYGSAAYTICKVADGGVGGYTIFDVDINDIFAGPLLVSEAGGIVSDDHGKSISRTTRTLLVAGNTALHRHYRDRLQSSAR